MAKTVSLEVKKAVIRELEDWVFDHPCFEPERCYWTFDGHFLGNSDAYEDDVLNGDIFEYIDYLINIKIKILKIKKED
jgi:hypothetical protein